MLDPVGVQVRVTSVRSLVLPGQTNTVAVRDGIQRCDEVPGRGREGASTVGTPGGDQQVSIVSESGLYSLILLVPHGN